MITMRAAVLLVLSGFLGLVSAHVRLTFPPARKYDFDFLDNARTIGPCGMESDGSVTTEFTKGADIGVTWHLAYSHRGGFRLELWQAGNISSYLAGSEGDFINSDDITTTSYDVALPADFVGEGTLRLVRHAGEWAIGGGGQYIFWSCADINVVDGPSDCNGGCQADDCVDGRCTSCPHLSSGDYCQYTDDCLTSDDCNDHGECWKVSDSSYPQNQCFCEEAWYGRNCKKANPSDFSVNIDKSKFWMRSLTDDFTVYYLIREAEGEVEIAVEAASTSWVALGWKPSNLAGSCQNFPVQYRTGAGGDNPDSEPESEPEATSEPPSTGRRRRSHQLSPDLQEEDNSFYGSDYVCGQSGGDDGPAAEPEGTREPAAEPEGTVEPAAEPEGTVEPAAEPEGTVEPAAEPEGTAEPAVELDGTAEPAAEPEGTAEPAVEPEGEPTSGANLHAMDCMDVMIGRAKGHLGNVGDYYTRDRSTPRLDKEFYGGQDDLVAAGAKQENGITTVVFRRKLTTTDQADHDIVTGGMDLTWARGQEMGQEFHRPNSGLESCEAKDPTDYNFYRKDDIKYHGTHTNQRGVVRGLDFFVDPNAQGPDGCTETIRQGCSGSTCDYVVSWAYTGENSEAVRFTIEARTDMDKWTGVGFSPTGSMPGSDAVLAWHDGTEGFVKDYYLGGRTTSLVVEDDVSNIEDTSVSYEDGVLRVAFTRRPNTGDSEQDVALDAGDCVFLLTPLNGGGYSGGQVQYHTERPLTTTRKHCFSGCQSENQPGGGLDTGTTECPKDAGCGGASLLPSLLLVPLAVMLLKTLLG